MAEIVITTVGCSLITKYLEANEDRILQSKLKLYAKERYNERTVNDLKSLKNKLFSWAKDNIPNASAEITSLQKIQQFLNRPLEVYLISTDSIESSLIAGILKDIFHDHDEIKIYFNPQTDVIKGLQVYIMNELRSRGLPNLIKRINDIAGGFYKNVAFNISGGYKGIIPYLALMGFVNNCDIYYIFEESEELIRIPRAPVAIDVELFEKYLREIVSLQDGVSYGQFKKENYQVIEELEQRGLVESADDIAYLSPLGNILFNSYTNEHFIFYVTDEVERERGKQKEIERILSTKFWDKQQRDSKTEIKTQGRGKHRVYDDGNNPNRIYYFERDDKVYIYKIFENEETAKAYIAEPLNEENVIGKSQIQKIRKQVRSDV